MRPFSVEVLFNIADALEVNAGDLLNARFPNPGKHPKKNRTAAGRKAAAVLLVIAQIFQASLNRERPLLSYNSESNKEVRPCAACRPFRLQRNRAAGHTLRVLLRAQNSLRSFSGARSPNPAPSARLKNADFAPMNGKSAFFYTPLPDGSEPRTAELWHFFERTRNSKNAFVCSHPTDASKNDIGNRAGRDRFQARTQAAFRTACVRKGRCAEIISRQRQARGWPPIPNPFSGHAQRERANVILAVSRARKRHLVRRWVRGHRSDALKNTNSPVVGVGICVFSGTEGPALLATFLAHQESGTLHSKEKPEFQRLCKSKNRSSLIARPPSLLPFGPQRRRRARRPPHKKRNLPAAGLPFCIMRQNARKL